MSTHCTNTVIDLLGNILCSSIKNLFDHQHDIFNFTTQTGETEWNLGHHLANEIHEYIFWLDCDIDLTKTNYHNRRPDIVFHKRGIHALNFLVIELKHRGASSDEDIRRIKEDWMGSNLNYRFGASINISGKSEYKAIVFHGNAKREFNQNSNYIRLTNHLSARELNATVGKIFNIKRADPSSDMSSLECKIDKIIYDLYALTP